MNRNKMVLALAMLALVWSGSLLAADSGIHRAQFTTAVEDREPIDSVTELGTDHDRIIFFMEVRGMEGAELVHRYRFDGEVQAEVDLAIGGPRWRTWSSKRLVPEWQGTWTVDVVDSEGEVHGSWSFEYSDDHVPEYPAENGDD
ncbi:DUF2914 domain-containing protein [Natronospira bacteriovora]|uniref:DUF2914 domain-containing protein n=1 Tax=Natronospira bacteriovora TaxID=3069753 RepID=A0ABU0WBG2_9GAMM|nr:DUF2914 domain-containing protein [Natronospira sp. AB-CW4]MDQ2070275.1 DUF2914 domain-containing protein [Natronospira sp. AB-CW4]